MTTERTGPAPRLPEPLLRPAGDMLRRGRAEDRAGRLDDAVASYEQAVRLGEASGERAMVVEALRRLGVVHHRRNEGDLADELCRRSHREAVELGDLVLAGEALNALAGFEFEKGGSAGARGIYLNALVLAGSSNALRGRIEQNLGILASIQGDYPGASGHYARSLEAFEQAGDERGVVALVWGVAAFLECFFAFGPVQNPAPPASSTVTRGGGGKPPSTVSSG